MRGVQAITPYAQLDPSILDVVNFDQYARKILDAFGAKSTILRSEEDIEKLREDRANQQQAQQLLVAAQPVANAAKSAAQASQISNQIDREQ